MGEASSLSRYGLIMVCAWRFFLSRVEGEGTRYKYNYKYCPHSSQCGTFCESGDVLLTSEQARVVTYPIQKGETIKVIAFAGT